MESQKALAIEYLEQAGEDVAGLANNTMKVVNERLEIYRNKHLAIASDSKAAREQLQLDLTAQVESYRAIQAEMELFAPEPKSDTDDADPIAVAAAAEQAEIDIATRRSARLQQIRAMDSEYFRQTGEADAAHATELAEKAARDREAAGQLAIQLARGIGDSMIQGMDVDGMKGIFKQALLAYLDYLQAKLLIADADAGIAFFLGDITAPARVALVHAGVGLAKAGIHQLAEGAIR